MEEKNVARQAIRMIDKRAIFYWLPVRKNRADWVIFNTIDSAYNVLINCENFPFVQLLYLLSISFVLR